MCIAGYCVNASFNNIVRRSSMLYLLVCQNEAFVLLNPFENPSSQLMGKYSTKEGRGEWGKMGKVDHPINSRSPYANGMNLCYA